MRTVLALVTLALVSLNAEATHFRYGHISWRPIDTSGQVEVTVTAAFRNAWGVDIGDYFFESIGETTLDLGDGSFIDPGQWHVIGLSENGQVVIAKLDPDRNGSDVVKHRYVAPGTYTVRIFSCCRISPPTHINNPDGDYQVITSVAPSFGAFGNASPVSGMPPIVDFLQEYMNTFQVPATDPDRDPLLYGLATAEEASGSPGGFVQPGSPHAPNALKIDPQTGIITWDSTGASLNGGGDTLYSCQLTIKDDATQVATDFFIRLIPNTGNKCPRFNSPPTPPDGSTLEVIAGRSLVFQVEASDADTGDSVTLDHLGLPPGASFTGGSGNPARGEFRWDTGPGNAGNYVVIFTADDGECTKYTSVNLAVGKGCIDPCTPPTSGLVSWWPGNGDAGDFSGVNVGQLFGSVMFPDGKVGRAFRFDGDDDGVTIPDTKTLHQEDALTVEFWIKASPNQDGAHNQNRWLVVDKSHGGSSEDHTGWAFQGHAIDTKELYFIVGDGIAFYGEGADQGAVVNDNQWHHIAGTVDGFFIRFYVDGQLEGETSFTGPIAQNNRAVNLGFHYNLDRHFRGDIDELSIYDRALRQDEIQAIVEAGSSGKCMDREKACVAPPPNLVSYWPGEGGAGDWQGINDGYLMGTPAFVPGKVGRAPYFATRDEGIQVCDSSSLHQETSLSVAFWMKAALNQNSEAGDHLFSVVEKSLGNGDASGWSILGDDRTGELYFYIGTGEFDNNGNEIFAVAGPSKPLLGNGWHLITGTFDGSLVTLYVDGEAIGSRAPFTGTIAQNDRPINIGFNNNGKNWNRVCGLGSAPRNRFFRGSVDELMIFDQALEQAEIKALWEAGSAGICRDIQCCPDDGCGKIKKATCKDGTITVSGNGEAGKQIKIEVDGVEIECVTIGGNGKWKTKIKSQVAGAHTVTACGGSKSVTCKGGGGGGGEKLPDLISAFGYSKGPNGLNISVNTTNKGTAEAGASKTRLAVSDNNGVEQILIDFDVPILV